MWLASVLLLKAGAPCQLKPRCKVLICLRDTSKYKMWVGRIILQKHVVVISGVIFETDLSTQASMSLLICIVWLSSWYSIVGNCRSKTLFKELRMIVTLKSTPFFKSFTQKSPLLLFLKPTSSPMHSRKLWMLMGECLRLVVLILLQNSGFYVQIFCTFWWWSLVFLDTYFKYDFAGWHAIKRQILGVSL